jgi:hypothetical protein
LLPQRSHFTTEIDSLVEGRIRTPGPPPEVDQMVSKDAVPFHGDQWFESVFLQQRDGMGQAAKEMAPSSLANN